MANSSLQGKYFPIPENISKHLNRIHKAYKGPKNAEGYQRLEELVSKTESEDNNKISYEQLKLIKNFFDSYNGGIKETPYLLNGGTFMKEWVNKTLEGARNWVNSKEKNMSKVGMEKDSDIRLDTKINTRINQHDTNTNKILRQEGIYSLGIIKDLITTIDKNRELCQMDNKSHQF